jgi:hypothetical protein
LAAHLDYIHFNPVKHGLVEHPAQWHSSFRRCVAGGLQPAGCVRSAGEPPEGTARYADDSQRRKALRFSALRLLLIRC